MLYYFRYAVKIEKKQESVSKLSFVPALDAGSHYGKRENKGILTHFLSFRLISGFDSIVVLCQFRIDIDLLLRNRADKVCFV